MLGACLPCRVTVAFKTAFAFIEQSLGELWRRWSEELATSLIPQNQLLTIAYLQTHATADFDYFH